MSFSWTTIVYMLFCAIGMPANFIVIVVLLKGHFFSTQSSSCRKIFSNLFILNVSMADLIMLFHLPLHIDRRMRQVWRWGQVLCICDNSVKIMCMFVSIILLASLSIFRYKGLLKGMKFDDNHYQQAKISVPFAWLCGFMLIIPIARNTVYENDTCGIDWNNKPQTNMPSFIKAESGANTSLTEESSYVEAEDYGSEDPLDWMSSVVEDDDFLSKILKNDSELIELDQFHDSCSGEMPLIQREYYVIMLIVGYLLPLLIITFCYRKITLIINNSSSRFNHHDSVRVKRKNYLQISKDGNRSNSTSSTLISVEVKDDRMLVTLWMLIISFFICWTPLHVVHVLLMSGVRIPLSYCALMQDMANVFAWANPVLNPLLYAFAGKQFRSDFRKLLKRRKESSNRRFCDESPSLTHEQSQKSQPLQLVPINSTQKI